MLVYVDTLTVLKDGAIWKQTGDENHHGDNLGEDVSTAADSLPPSRPQGFKLGCKDKIVRLHSREEETYVQTTSQKPTTQNESFLQEGVCFCVCPTLRSCTLICAYINSL